MEKQKNKKSALKITISIFLAIGLIISFLPFEASVLWNKVFSFFGINDFSAAADASPMAVHILEVGKADSIFIQCNGNYMLVDGGTADCGEKIYEYLYRKGVKHLDYVVNTHPDKDHIGGLRYLLKNLDVKKYFYSNIPKNLIPKSEEYIDVQKVLNNKDIQTEKLCFGDSFNLSDIKINVLGPVKQGNSTNNNSIVLRLTFGKNNFLLMGDAEKEEEMDIVNSGADISSDFIKIGHHGSGTSTSYLFLNAVNPCYAAISVTDDTNHLPKKSVLKRLQSKNIRTYRTDVDGTLIFMSDGNEISVATRR